MTVARTRPMRSIDLASIDDAHARLGRSLRYAESNSKRRAPPWSYGNRISREPRTLGCSSKCCDGEPASDTILRIAEERSLDEQNVLAQLRERRSTS